MASGSITLSLPKSNAIKFSWQTTGQSGMYTYISWTATWSSWNSKTTIYSDIACSINGEEVAWTDGHGGVAATNKQFGSGSYTLTRDQATNTAPLTINLSYGSGYYIDHANNGDEVNFTGSSSSKTWTVTTTTTYGMPAQITAVSDFTDETSPVITYTYDKGTQVTSVELFAGISFTGANMDIPYRTIPNTGNTYTFNFTTSEKETLYRLLASGSTASVRFMIKTVENINGEILEQEKSFPKTFTFVNFTPLLRPEVWDTNPATLAVTHNKNVLVKYMSTVDYDMNVELRKGGLDVIGSYVSNGGHIVEGFTEGTYGAPMSNIFYFSATDDRGYTGTADVNLSMFYGEFIDYVKLTNSLKCTPIDARGKFTVTVSGKYFSAQFGPDGETNRMTYSYKVYKKGTTAEWSTAQVITPEMTDNTTYVFSFDHEGLDYTQQYIVEVRVNDLLMTVSSLVGVVAKPVFYWNNDEFNFNVPVAINGWTVDTVEEEGSASGYYMNSGGAYADGGYTWHYKKWSSGLLECWCTVPISTTVNASWGNLYVASAQYKTDLAYPVQPKETPLIMVSLGAGSARGMLIADSSYAADNISTGRYTIASGSAISSNTTFRINYYVRGKWK